MRTVLGMSHFRPFLKLFIYIARAPDMFLCLLLYITRARINRKRFVKAKNLRHAPYLIALPRPSAHKKTPANPPKAAVLRVYAFPLREG